MNENCEIYINNELILFSYFYKFNKKGKYKIKYIFKDKIKNMSCMFFGCSSLTNINLSNFNTNNITVMRYMFAKCLSLTNIDLSKFNTNKVIDMKGMFYGCGKLNRNGIITKDKKVLEQLNLWIKFS